MSADLEAWLTEYVDYWPKSFFRRELWAIQDEKGEPLTSYQRRSHEALAWKAACEGMLLNYKASLRDHAAALATLRELASHYMGRCRVYAINAAKRGGQPIDLSRLQC